VGSRAFEPKTSGLTRSGAERPLTLELAEWANILDQADAIIVKMKEMPRGTHKDQVLTFYSQAAVQFRYFKDGWRVRVAHARETYEETAAIRVFNHTHEFFETLSARLKEPKPSV
jgi:hypothetical protein